jgi:hypothetical protein
MTVDNYKIKQLSIISDTFGEYSIARGAAINYYEDILCPTISLSITFVDTDGVLSNGPILGGESLVGEIYFPYANQSLKFTKNHKIINQTTGDAFTKSSGQMATLNGFSLECLKNETIRLGKKYEGNIGNTVKSLLNGSEKSLQTKKKINSENTTNSYSFIGNQKRPFDTIQWLCPKSQNGTTSGGFLFFETLDGYVFKSVDTLLKQSSVATYKKTEIVNPGDRFVIISDYLTKNSDQSAMSRMGMYANKTIYWDSKNMKMQNDTQYQVTKVSQVSPKKYPKLPENLHDQPTRFMFRMLDVGALQSGETTEDEQKPEELSKYQNQTYIRLNLLFSQSLNILVPLNPDLRAGQVITVQFPLPTSDQEKKKFGTDKTKDPSGNYLISQLKHSIYNNRAYTALKLIRDSFT